VKKIKRRMPAAKAAQMQALKECLGELIYILRHQGLAEEFKVKAAAAMNPTVAVSTP
jgi:hypothetical protein